MIQLSLFSHVAFNIVNEKTTMNLMTIVTRMYEKLSAFNKAFLTKRLFNMKMIDVSPVVEHLNNLNTMMN